MSLDILKQRLKENKPGGVYLFYGNEEYTKDFYARELRKKVTASPLPEFNHIIFDASASGPTSLPSRFFRCPICGIIS
jgi:DNA polymerase III delta subunit